MAGKRDFERFKKAFKKYQSLFGMDNYRVFFFFEPLDNSFASIYVDQRNQAATVRYNSDTPKDELEDRSPEKSAKHEAIHLMVHGLEALANRRFIMEEDLDTAVEGLVMRLENLI